jgi:SPP1 gp7 family putative phage head morphogenesis protein
MQDYGTRQTDLAVKRAEWRLSRVYHQAARDIENKLKTWEKGHTEREKRYRQQLADGKITQADFDAWMRGQVFQEKQWLARRDEIDAILLNADKVAAKIVNEGKLGVFADNANYIGYDLEHSAGINTGFTLYDQATVARLVKSDPQILPKAREGVKKDKAYSYYNKLMNSAITQGIVQGETSPQIAKRIAQTTGERSYTSAVRNARTAYTGAQNAGRIEGLHQAQSLGIKVQKKWMATLDNRTRDAHADLDGQVRDVDEPFDSELGPIDYPGDPTADPSLVYNCRCTLVYVYPEYPSEMQRRDNETGEIVGDMTYREWEAMKRGNR